MVWYCCLVAVLFGVFLYLLEFCTLMGGEESGGDGEVG